MPTEKQDKEENGTNQLIYLYETELTGHNQSSIKASG